MSRLGLLLLVPLIVATWGLYRLWRAGRGERAGGLLPPFLVASLLVHAGLLLGLDLILITVPVVEAHRELIEDLVVRTFTVPSTRPPASRAWEVLPEGPPPPEPVSTAEAIGPAAAIERPFAPELRSMTPTITVAEARVLPPARVLYLPEAAPPLAGDASSALPRAAAPPLLALPELELPALEPVPMPAEAVPEPSVVGMGRRDEPLPDADREPSIAPTPTPRLPERAEGRPPSLPDLLLATERPLLPFDRPMPRTLPSDPVPTEPPVPSSVAAVERMPAEEATAPGRSAVKELANPLPRVTQPRETLKIASPRLLERPQIALVPRPDFRPPALPEVRRPRLDDAPAAFARDGLELTSGLVLRRSAARNAVVAAMGGSAESEAAVARGLGWLAAHQAPEGNWSLHTFSCKGHKCDATGSERSDAAATGLALMAFLGAGHLPGEGPHAESLRLGLAWLVAHQKPDGDLAGPSGSQMYGHALATIALCEALALGGDPALREPAARALQFIEQAQDPKSGGWRYRPRSGGDTSVFGWQLMALKSGEMAGLPVPAEVYPRAGKWLDSVAAGPGRRLSSYTPGGGPSPPMTAEALLCRQYLGTPRLAETMVAGGNYLKANLPQWKARDAYYWYYATQVMFHLQGEPWALWNATLRDMLVGAQVQEGPAAGSWHPRNPSRDVYGDRGGRLFETALSLLMLEVYYRHLPLYQQLGQDLPAETPAPR